MDTVDKEPGAFMFSKNPLGRNGSKRGDSNGAMDPHVLSRMNGTIKIIENYREKLQEEAKLKKKSTLKV